MGRVRRTPHGYVAGAAVVALGSILTWIPVSIAADRPSPGGPAVVGDPHAVAQFTTTYGDSPVTRLADFATARRR